MVLNQSQKLSVSLPNVFFLTHRALDLGYRVVLDKFLRTSQSLVRIQRVYQDAQSGGRSEVLETITERMEEEMTKYLSLRASLFGARDAKTFWPSSMRQQHSGWCKCTWTM